MDTRITRGGCLCGSVRYEARDEPYHITHCHCSDCRKSSGAPFVTWASFRRTDFYLTTGELRQTIWAGRIRSFCPNCGTALTFMPNAEAKEVDVTVSSFDEPGSVTPGDHTWVEDRLSWIHLADGLPAYRRGERILRVRNTNASFCAPFRMGKFHAWRLSPDSTSLLWLSRCRIGGWILEFR